MQKLEWISVELSGLKLVEGYWVTSTRRTREATHRDKIILLEACMEPYLLGWLRDYDESNALEFPWNLFQGTDDLLQVGKPPTGLGS